MGYANTVVVSQHKVASLKHILCWLWGAVSGEIRFVVICMCFVPQTWPEALHTGAQAVITIQWDVYCDSRTFLLPHYLPYLSQSLCSHCMDDHGFLWQCCPTTAMKMSPMNINNCIEQALVQISNLFCLLFFLLGNGNLSKWFILNKSISHCAKLNL